MEFQRAQNLLGVVRGFLYYICRYGCTSVAKKLMEGRGKRTVNGNDVYERTPLHLAAQQGHDELVEFFLKRGAKIDR